MLEQAVVIEKPVHIEQIFINATPEQVWEAITDPEFTAQFFYNGRVKSDFRPGAPLTYVDERDGSLQIEGIVVEADKPRRLVLDEKYVWAPDVAADPVHREVWEIEPLGKVCKLTVSFYEVALDCATMRSILGGIPLIVSGLKTLLETGKPLPSR
ncbi:MAG: hypothetical protein E6J49_12615 [Chloroflexi bacterium]|nr:MAG: hypothetical protein E6J49_12615 [Chloroflexota bacterium]